MEGKKARTTNPVAILWKREEHLIWKESLRWHSSDFFHLEIRLFGSSPQFLPVELNQRTLQSMVTI